MLYVKYRFNVNNESIMIEASYKEAVPIGFKIIERIMHLYFHSHFQISDISNTSLNTGMMTMHTKKSISMLQAEIEAE
jgi:hypothetical protein